MGYESFWPGVFAVVLFTFIVNCAAQVQVEIERPTAKTTGKPITPRNSSTTTASNSSASFNLGIMAKAGIQFLKSIHFKTQLNKMQIFFS